MRRLFFMTVGGLLSSMSFMAFAECSMASCDTSNGPGACEHEIAVYYTCVDHEAQLRWSAGRVAKPDASTTADASGHAGDPQASPASTAPSNKKQEPPAAPAAQ
jgi:hypothetical protein